MAAADGLPAYTGRIRTPGSHGSPGTVTLDEATAVIAADGLPPRTLAYRDLGILGLDSGVGLVATGAGPGDERWLLEGFGAAAGPLIAALRERRLRQRLADAFIDLPEGEPVELVEYAIGGPGAGACCSPAADAEAGVAQLAVDAWGVTLAPLDERRPARRVRRAEIDAVRHLPEVGGVQVTAAGNGFHLLRLGGAATRHRDRLAALPAAAHRDAGAMVAALVPDIAPAAAGRAAAALVDGRPASPGDLGDAWDAVERGVLSEPTFAASYLALRERAGGVDAMRWLALAPTRPGAPDERRAWFLVALPGNLVALELVSEGAHATYCFRAGPRAAQSGGADPAAIDGAAARGTVGRISAALVDARFLREPIALPDDQLATPKGIRYRLALRALPSLAAARAAFVARLVHRDEESWSAALDDLIAWHGSCRDDAATWPGRAAQEAQVADAAGAGGG
ncbi:MAG: hypothetical protein MUC54_00240 [Chloroflexi bacterium]|nr:hypothetical protein [Chloroflexota bacterium]